MTDWTEHELQGEQQREFRLGKQVQEMICSSTVAVAACEHCGKSPDLLATVYGYTFICCDLESEPRMSYHKALLAWNSLQEARRGEGRIGE